MKLSVELRKNSDGSLDEAILYADGECVAHLEQLSEQSWYLNFYHGDRACPRSVCGRRKVVWNRTRATMLTIEARNGKAWVDATVVQDDGAKVVTT